MIYFFDICDTLYKSNTTFDFIDFYFKRQRRLVKRIFLQGIRSRRSPLFFLLAIAGRVYGVDLHKRIAIKLLRGEHKERLEVMAERFYEEVLRNTAIKTTRGLLDEARSREDRVILLSATIDPVAKIIADKLACSYICSGLEYVDDKATGKIVFDLAGMKETIVRRHFGDIEYAVVTDNFSDFELVKGAQIRFVVVYNKKSEEHWKTLNPALIKPNEIM